MFRLFEIHVWKNKASIFNFFIIMMIWLNIAITHFNMSLIQANFFWALLALSRLFQRNFYKYLSWNAQKNACNKTVYCMENLLSELQMLHKFWGTYANIVFKLVKNWGALQYFRSPITFQMLKGTLKNFSLSMGVQVCS